jgi:hypothetical protein
MHTCKSVFLLRVLRLLVTVKLVLGSLTFITLIIEAILSSEISVLARATRRHIPEDRILHSHRS